MTLSASPTAIALLTLMKLKRFGRRKALRVIDEPMGELDPNDCKETLISRLSRENQARCSPTELQNAWAKSVEQLELSEKFGIQALSFHDEGYPKRLQKIPDPPAVLFVKGNKDVLHMAKSIAVVGTREPTPYGEEVAQRVACTAAKMGFMIVSGLAHGCDTYAHEGCLTAQGGIGVAVLAHGLDKVYPAANRDLAQRLLDKGGSLVSEYPFGVTPVRSAFAERDRLQSGLSDAVLVIETDVKGGTMHTVRFARDQARSLACIAHSEQFLTEDKTKGNQKLIKDGWATPITDCESWKRFLNDITPIVSGKVQMGSGSDIYKQQIPIAFIE